MKQVVLILALAGSLLAHGEGGLRGEFLVQGGATLRALSSDTRYAAVSFPVTIGPASVQVIDLQKGQVVFDHTLYRPNVSLVFSPDSSELLIGLENGFIESWDLRTQTKMTDRQVFRDMPVGAISAMQLPDGGVLLLASSYSATTLLQYPSLNPLYVFPRAHQQEAPLSEIEFSDLRFTSAIDPDGKWAVETDFTLGQVHLLDLTQGTENTINGYGFWSAGNGGVTLPANFRLSMPVGETTALRAGFDQGSTISILVGSIPNIVGLFHYDRNCRVTQPTSLMNIHPHLAPSLHSLPQAASHAIFFPSDNSRPDGTECARFIGGSHRLDLNCARPVLYSSVQISQDGKTAVTLTDCRTLSVWSLP